MKLLEIFGVKSKEEIGNIETKEILAKLDSVFKIREDNQPNVDYPVRKINIYITWIILFHVKNKLRIEVKDSISYHLSFFWFLGMVTTNVRIAWFEDVGSLTPSMDGSITLKRMDCLQRLFWYIESIEKGRRYMNHMV